MRRDISRMHAADTSAAEHGNPEHASLLMLKNNEHCTALDLSIRAP
jgi:hypothetical protein